MELKEVETPKRTVTRYRVTDNGEGGFDILPVEGSPDNSPALTDGTEVYRCNAVDPILTALVELYSVLLDPEMPQTTEALIQAAKNVCANEEHYRKALTTIEQEKQTLGHDLDDAMEAIRASRTYYENLLNISASNEADLRKQVSGMQQVNVDLQDKLQSVIKDLDHLCGQAPSYLQGPS